MRVIRKIELDDDYKPQNYVEYQALYMNHRTADLIPNTEIWQHGGLRMKVNSLGCKGAELRPGVPVIACFGCSTTLCVANDSWASRIAIPGHQALNCGVEGYSMDMCLRRYHALKAKVSLKVVLLYLGWHNLIYNQTGPDYWRQVLDGFLGDGHITAVCTLPTCLTEDCCRRGVTELLSTDGSKPFYYWGDMKPTPAHIAALWAQIQAYNAFVRLYAAEKRLVLLELYALLRPASYAQIPVEFFDVCHMRSTTYPKVAEYISERLGQALGHCVASKSEAKTQAAVEVSIEELLGQIYPLF